MSEPFRELFDGLQFAIGDNFFDKQSRAPRSKFEFHCSRVSAAFLHGFRCRDTKEKYVAAFSSAN